MKKTAISNVAQRPSASEGRPGETQGIRPGETQDSQRPSAGEGRPGETHTGDAWSAQIERFDADLQRRGAADRTRRAYGTDVEELARWATGLGLGPTQIGYPALRRYAARLSERGAAP